MPSICAWCGSKEVIGNFPVVIDKSRILGLSLEFLKHEDRIYNFLFPICQKCKGQIRTRRILDNSAIQFITATGLITVILLSIINRNIGFSIFTSFGTSAILFILYFVIKNTTLRLMKYASEMSWGNYDGKQFYFRIGEFNKQFKKNNPK